MTLAHDSKDHDHQDTRRDAQKPPQQAEKAPVLPPVSLIIGGATIGNIKPSKVKEIQAKVKEFNDYLKSCECTGGTLVLSDVPDGRSLYPTFDEAHGEGQPPGTGPSPTKLTEDAGTPFIPPNPGPQRDLRERP